MLSVGLQAAFPTTEDNRRPLRRDTVQERIRRVEDERLLRGEGCFAADHTLEGVVHAVEVRSRVACGRIAGIDTQAVRAAPGVLDVMTGKDVVEAGLGGIPWEVCPPGFEAKARYTGDPEISRAQPLLAVDRVHYVGEPIAFVVADTLIHALDASERLHVEIDDEEPLVDVRHAAERADPLFRYRLGASVADRLAAADIVVEIKTHIPRLVPAPLEARGYIATFHPIETVWTVIASAGKPHPVRDTIANFVFGVAPSTIRVLTPDIGGGFGGKNVAHAEMALAMWAAKRTGRPVQWISGRNEAFLSDMQGRDHAISARLAVDKRGRMIALEYVSSVNLGAYLAPRGVIPALSGLKVVTGPYRVPHVSIDVAGYHTNTVPTCPYRGAGAPETAFVLERLVDMAAARLGLDAAEIRRRNLVRPADLPFSAATGAEFHSVDFPSVLETAVSQAGWGPRRRRTRSRTGSKRRGRGMAFTIEGYGTSFDEAAEIVLCHDGRIEVLIGTKSAGQSHETTYAQIVADVFQVDMLRIVVVQNDTARIKRGNGTGASRSLTTGGSAVLRAAQACLAQAQVQAGLLLQSDPDQLTYREGRFESDNGAAVGLDEVAHLAPGGRLSITEVFKPDRFSFPGGCHIAEVEVDLDTGKTEILSYLAVHDAGVAVNPMVVEGQLQGAIAQGIGAALMEKVEYDSESGQITTATFQDYAIPRAADISGMRIVLRGTPCSSNPLGAKAVGEAGTVAAPPAVINAIVDALRGFDVRHIDLPATPPHVRRALVEARPSTTMQAASSSRNRKVTA